MDYLERRGRNVEVLFGFQKERTLALVAKANLFMQGVTLARGADGAVRCRLGGAPGALVEVAPELWLDVVKLGREWPGLVSELVGRVGEEGARALLSAPAWLEVLGPGGNALEELVLEHSIRAEDLHVLGETPPSPATLAGEPRFTLEFELGRLELGYSAAAFAEAHERSDNAFVAPTAEVALSWCAEAIALPEDPSWHDAELVEVLMLGTMMIDGQPEQVGDFFDASFPDGVGALEPSEVVGSILNLWGVVHRRGARLEDAMDVLKEALTIAEATSPKLEQQVAYNLGYAELQTTMKSQSLVTRSPSGPELFTSNFEVDERHRATWTGCLARFERALELAPDDGVAADQVRVTEQLLGLLDVDPGERHRAEAKEADAEAKESDGELRSSLASVGLVVFLLALLVTGMALGWFD